MEKLGAGIKPAPYLHTSGFTKVKRAVMIRHALLETLSFSGCELKLFLEVLNGRKSEACVRLFNE